MTMASDRLATMPHPSSGSVVRDPDKGGGLAAGGIDAIIVGVEAFVVFFRSLTTSERKKTENANK